ncbi:uncharacterized protein LOC141607797 [Silene latifolia]|uniref:uncharacterized protein LOC141607797 n=1 Tax=Silene latifolia TaxID=37657 RepID=UPI003D76DB1E
MTTLPKDAGGLGIKKAKTWNWAAVGKLVNWVYNKADRLRIKWISNVYLKTQDWHSYSPPADSPWTWKNICKIKEKLKEGFIENCWMPNEKGYTLKNGYVWLSTQQPKLDWCSLVWNSWNIPKHSIITWLIMQEGLNVKTRLFQFGYCEDNLCLFCGELPETIAHLFYDCIYSCKIREALAVWLGRSFPGLTELRNGRKNSMQWKATPILFNVYLYTIWHQRNNTRIQLSVLRPELVASQV